VLSGVLLRGAQIIPKREDNVQGILIINHFNCLLIINFVHCNILIGEVEWQ
jgi:hypothetical protein